MASMIYDSKRTLFSQSIVESTPGAGTYDISKSPAKEALGGETFGRTSRDEVRPSRPTLHPNFFNFTLLAFANSHPPIHQHPPPQPITV